MMHLFPLILRLKKELIYVVAVIAVLLFLIFLPFSRPFCQEELQIKDVIAFEQIHYFDGVSNRVFADFDLDGIEEFIEAGVVGKGIVLVDLDKGMPPTTVWHAAATLECGEVEALDFAGDPAPEVFLPLKRGNKTWAQVYQNVHGSGETGYQLLLGTEPVSGKDINGDGEWDGMMRHFLVLDVNADGQKDIVAGLDIGYDKNPRGLLAFDGKTGKKLWYFPTAPNVCYVHLADINQDGVEEILFATNAPCNASFVNDMDDYHSYLVCLTNQGKLLWKKEIGGAFTVPKYVCGDVDDDGELEIICTYATGDSQDKSTEYELQIRYAQTGEVKKYRRLPTCFGPPFLADLNRDGKNEIIVANENRTINVFDTGLTPRNQKVLPDSFEGCEICEIEDINQDGEKEIIAKATRNVLIFDSRLGLLGAYPTTKKVWRVHFLRHPLLGGVLSLIEGRLPYRNASFLRVRFESKLKKTFVSLAKYRTVSFAVIFALGVMLTLLALKMVPSLWRNIRYSGIRKIEEKRDALLETLSVFGHGKMATANLDRLSLLFKNLPKDKLPSLEYRKKIDEAVTTYFDFASGRLFEINKKSRLAEINRGQIELLEQNLRKLESLLRDYKRKGITQSPIERLSQEVPLIVKSLEESVESLWKELAHYYSCDIIVSIQEVLAAVSDDMKKENVEFKNLYVEGDVGAKAFIDKSDFATVFEELITNAIYSMKETTRKETVVKISIGESKITVEVADTGCGMKREDFEKIFDREYSTKKEGGFGLYHAKATLNKYGGKIKVAESKPGAGTAMKIDVRRI